MAFPESIPIPGMKLCLVLSVHRMDWVIVAADISEDVSSEQSEDSVVPRDDMERCPRR